MQVLLLQRYGEAHRLEDDYYSNNGLFLPIPKERGYAMPLTATWGSIGKEVQPGDLWFHEKDKVMPS